MQRKIIWYKFQSPLDRLDLKMRTRIILYATFIHSDPRHARADKLRGNEAKREEVETEPRRKWAISHTLI